MLCFKKLPKSLQDGEGLLGKVLHVETFLVITTLQKPSPLPYPTTHLVIKMHQDEVLPG